MQKLFNFFGWLVIGAMFFFYGYYFYNNLRPVKTATVESPMKVLTPIVKAGDDVVYHVKYCRYSQAPAKTYKSLVGASIVNLPVTESAAPTGCRENDVHLNVPAYVEPGQYYVKSVAEFQINANRVERIEYESELFLITK